MYRKHKCSPNVHFLALMVGVLAALYVGVPVSGDVVSFTGGESVGAGADTDAIVGIDVDPLTGQLFALNHFAAPQLFRFTDDGSGFEEDIAELENDGMRATDMRFHPVTGNLFVLYHEASRLDVQLWEFGRDVLTCAGQSDSACGDVEPIRVTTPISISNSAEQLAASQFTFLGDGSLLFQRPDSMVVVDPATNNVLRTFEQKLSGAGWVRGIAFHQPTNSLVYVDGLSLGTFDLDDGSRYLDTMAAHRLFSRLPPSAFDEVAIVPDGSAAYFTVGEDSRSLFLVDLAPVPEPSAGLACVVAALAFASMRRSKACAA